MRIMVIAAFGASFIPAPAFAQFPTGGIAASTPCAPTSTSGQPVAYGSSLTGNVQSVPTISGGCNPNAGTIPGGTSGSSTGSQPPPSTAAVRPTVPLAIKPQVKPCIQPCK